MGRWLAFCIQIHGKAPRLARKPVRAPQPRSMTPMWLEEWLAGGQIMLYGRGHFMVPSTDVARLCFAAAADLWFHAYRAHDSTLLQLFEKSRSYDTSISENSYNLLIADRTQIFVFSIIEVLHSWREDKEGRRRRSYFLPPESGSNHFAPSPRD